MANGVYNETPRWFAKIQFRSQSAHDDVLDIRRDSPTACREAINVLLAVGASKGRENGHHITHFHSSGLLLHRVHQSHGQCSAQPSRHEVCGIQF